MTTYNLFTDPHLGTKRAAHTTRESAKKLQRALFNAALDVARLERKTICLGDLFDKAFNDEATIIQGYEIAGLCEWTLSGNHDETNRADTVTSLQALKDMGRSIVSSPNLNTAYFDAREALYFVPHHASQELFEQAMWNAANHAANERDGLPSVLMLHCNYDCQFDIQDDTLNLTAEMAERLLSAFDYIFLGHEHAPSTHLEGRVVILGNTHPTSFSDISNKYRYELAISDDSIELTPMMIWNAEEHYKVIKFGDEIPDLQDVQFVDIIGVEGEGSGPAVAQFVQEVWGAGEDLLAVRNNVVIGDHLAGVSETEAPKLVDIKQRIAEDLAGSDMAELYAELLREVEA